MRVRDSHWVTSRVFSGLSLLFLTQAVFGQLHRDFFGEINVAWQVHDGHYVAAEWDVNTRIRTNLKADRDSVGKWERFRVEFVDVGRVALKSIAIGKYVSSRGDAASSVTADRTRRGEWETFGYLPQSDSLVFGLLASNGRYLAAESGGGERLINNREELQSWETFRFLPLPLFAFETQNGHLIAAEASGEVACEEQSATPATRWKLERVRGDTAIISLSQGGYLHCGARSSKIVMEREEATRFHVRRSATYINRGKKRNRHYVEEATFMTLNRRYLSATGGGGFSLRLKAGAVGPFERFRLHPKAVPGTTKDDS